MAATMARGPHRCQARTWPGSHNHGLLTINTARHAPAILLTDQRDANESVVGLEAGGAALGGSRILGSGRAIAGCSMDGDRSATMSSIDRYIFRTTLASFALV